MCVNDSNGEPAGNFRETFWDRLEEFDIQLEELSIGSKGDEGCSSNDK
jgi:hypothetical protein